MKTILFTIAALLICQHAIAGEGYVLIDDGTHQFPPGQRALTTEEFSGLKKAIKKPTVAPQPRKKLTAIIAQDIDGLAAIVFVDPQGGIGECAFLMYLTRKNDKENFKGLTAEYVNLSESDRLLFRKFLKIDK